MSATLFFNATTLLFHVDHAPLPHRQTLRT
jgi:hypothetical protein